ncbi:MAG TPA: glycosyltransferase family 2 protein [Candidatus Woesebacteria bacterium]|nr:glycosyltransferase family 2 protein [Candidatus Woesebacteria bacterium]
MINTKNISVIVTNWNGLSLLKKYLETVIINSPEAQEIIVADDASTDNSLDFLKSLSKKYPKLKIISNSTNLGFGENSNNAVKIAKGDLIVMLNSDIKPHPNYIKNTLYHFKNENVYGVSFSELGHENYGQIYWKNGYLQHRPGYSLKPHSTDWLSGGSAIIRKDIFLKLNGFDPIYAPFYFEDLDLGIRAIQNGYQMFWEPNAIVEHRHEQTMSKIPRLYLTSIKERNHLIATWRYQSKNDQLKNILAMIFRVLTGPNYIKIILAARNQFQRYRHV